MFVFAPDPDKQSGRLYSRMFATSHGIAEDPATGSASGALGAYAVGHGLVANTGEVRIVSEQGTKMPSELRAHHAVRVGDQITDIRDGGGGVPVLEGRLTLP